ncbi:hypothetical protein ACFYU8_06695 [Brevibacillus sp. NPDC003359]|uniref:hypothetical protein n=1 Tax=unclassified Brevibacillus TaxID=2684853 RepID=UPI00367C6AAD
MLPTESYSATVATTILEHGEYDNIKKMFIERQIWDEKHQEFEAKLKEICLNNKK